MKIVMLAALATAMVVGASAQDRKISPLAIYGRWLGLPGAAPTDCNGDGYIVMFGATDDKTFLMTVQHRVNGVMPLDGKKTEYDVTPKPATAPAAIDVYLVSKDGQDLGVHVKTGSSIELYPSGPDKTFPTPSLVMMRCGA